MARKFLGWPPSAQASVDFRLLTPAEFARQLRREKARADRTRLPFSLLVLKPRTSAPNGEQLLTDIVRFSLSRLRSTDDVGQTQDLAVSVLLTDTDGEGAEVVAEAYRLQLGGDVMITIHTYPSNWLAELADDDLVQDGDSIHGATLCSLGPARGIDTYMVRDLPLWKRTIDIAGAIVGLALLSPLLVVVSLLIKITSPGPVFYRQRRSGLGGQPFWIYKFRSMVIDADAQKRELADQNEQDGPAFKIKRDPRVTSIGRFIRCLDIDELPQLWNVLRGEMTLVGPRPLPLHETAACENWHHERLQVTPGLTCIWQIEGRSRVSFDEWMRMDLEYARSVTPIRDLQLIVRTAWSVLVRKDRF